MARRVWLFWLLSVLLTTTVGWLAHNSDVRREQRQLGQTLATQLARSSAPWLLSQDMTSLNLLLAGLDARPGLAQVEILDGSGRRLASTALNGVPGQRITHDIMLGQQQLGDLVLTLHEPLATDWLRQHAGPLGLMAALQLLCFVLAGRQPRLSARKSPAETPAAEPVPTERASPFSPTAPLPASEALICIQPDNTRQLLDRLSQHLLTDMFEVMNRLLERVALLCDGELVRPMSGPEGALLRLSGSEKADRTWQALCAAELALQLAARAGEAREQENLLWLPMKAGMHCQLVGHQERIDIAGLLAWAAPAQQVLVSGKPGLPETVVQRARWGQSVQLDIPETGKLLATPLQALTHDAQAAIAEQARRLVPLATAPAAPESPPAALV